MKDADTWPGNEDGGEEESERLARERAADEDCSRLGLNAPGQIRPSIIDCALVQDSAFQRLACSDTLTRRIQSALVRRFDSFSNSERLTKVDWQPPSRR